MPDFQMIPGDGVSFVDDLGAETTAITAKPDGTTLEISGGMIAVKDGGLALAKIADIETAVVLGRRTAATGVTEKLPANDAGFDGLAGKSTVTAKTGDYVLLAADSGKRFTNASAGGNVQFTLPAAAVGLRYSFSVLASYQIDVLRAGADVIKESDASDKTHVQASTIGRTISITCTAAGVWTVDSVYGAWSML